jgi:uncharacterized spore protein YtfJ
VTLQTPGGLSSIVERARQQSDKIIDKIFAAAERDVVFSAPVQSGPFSVITSSEVLAYGCFGFGGGTGPQQAESTTSATETSAMPGGAGAGSGGGGGAGGGGGSLARPVAAIVIGPEGVKIEPIVDATKIALAGITTWAAVAFILVRMARARRKS